MLTMQALKFKLDAWRVQALKEPVMPKIAQQPVRVVWWTVFALSMLGVGFIANAWLAYLPLVAGFSLALGGLMLAFALSGVIAVLDFPVLYYIECIDQLAKDLDSGGDVSIELMRRRQIDSMMLGWLFGLLYSALGLLVFMGLASLLALPLAAALLIVPLVALTLSGLVVSGVLGWYRSKLSPVSGVRVKLVDKKYHQHLQLLKIFDELKAQLREQLTKEIRYAANDIETGLDSLQQSMLPTEAEEQRLPLAEIGASRVRRGEYSETLLQAMLEAENRDADIRYGDKLYKINFVFYVLAMASIAASICERSISSSYRRSASELQRQRNESYLEEADKFFVLGSTEWCKNFPDSLPFYRVLSQHYEQRGQAAVPPLSVPSESGISSGGGVAAIIVPAPTA